MTPIPMRTMIIQITTTLTDDLVVKFLPDTWARNLLSMLSHLRMTFPKSSETPTESVSLQASTPFILKYTVSCCSHFRTTIPLVIVVFRVADSQKEGKVSWEDFKVFETREFRWDRGRSSLAVM